jgi:hypothetical protein
MSKFEPLNPLLHAQLRLAVMSLLMQNKEGEFTFLRKEANANAGNLSVQINKLSAAGYIQVVKQFKQHYPQTICKITPSGVEAFETYSKALRAYLDPNCEWIIDN